jgi:hypothetical protein
VNYGLFGHERCIQFSFKNTNFLLCASALELIVAPCVVVNTLTDLEVRVLSLLSLCSWESEDVFAKFLQSLLTPLSCVIKASMRILVQLLAATHTGFCSGALAMDLQ